MKKKYKLVAKVPKTPKSSYNHNRFISDLLRQQVHHFHALEKSGLGPDEQPTNISKIKTELHASEYLKKMTAHLHPHGSHEPLKTVAPGASRKTKKSAQRKRSAKKKPRKRKRS